MLMRTLVVISVTAGCLAQVWTPPSYPPEVINEFQIKTYLNPPELPDKNWDPYDGNTNTTIGEEIVCAVHYPAVEDRSEYEIREYDSREDAEANGDFVTHKGQCGFCSSLQDMSVYMEKTDLTSAGRQCAMKLLKSNKQKCFENIGFTSPCARIWVENTIETRKKCLGVCLLYMNSPNNLPPDSYNLNPCLQCDEDESGPVFKAVSGRTRRNSGLISAINRPPDSIYQVEHDYY